MQPLAVQPDRLIVTPTMTTEKILNAYRPELILSLVSTTGDVLARSTVVLINGVGIISYRVARPYRKHGLGTRLLQATLEHIWPLRAGWAVLRGNMASRRMSRNVVGDDGCDVNGHIIFTNHRDISPLTVYRYNRRLV